jgi:DNA-binding NtrC family response regulator
VQGLAHVLVVGGSAMDRLAVAREFHREGVWNSGSLVAIDASADAAVIHGALQAWLSGIPLDSTHDLLRVAERGTLYLDRIASLPAPTQRLLMALLRGLDPGEGRERKWLGRIVTGSPEPLAAAVAGGRFARALEDALDKVRVELPADSAARRGAPGAPAQAPLGSPRAALARALTLGR